jgi:hypothetical protein
MGPITPIVFPSFGPKLSKDRVNDKPENTRNGTASRFPVHPFD